MNHDQFSVCRIQLLFWNWMLLTVPTVRECTRNLFISQEGNRSIVQICVMMIITIASFHIHQSSSCLHSHGQDLEMEGFEIANLSLKLWMTSILVDSFLAWRCFGWCDHGTMWEKSTMGAVGFQQGSSGRQHGLVQVCQQEPCALRFSLSQMSTLCRLVSILPPAEWSTNHLLQEHFWIECRLRFTSLGKGSLDKIQANTVALISAQHCTWVEWFHGYHGTSMGRSSSFNQYRVPVVGTTPSISPLKHCKSRGKSSWYVYLKLHNRLLFCAYPMDCLVPWNITSHISGRPCIQKIGNLG